jgi:hypothetical protein
MGEGSLLLRALHKHRDRRPNALIEKHHKNLVLVAKENRATAAYRGYGADLHFDNGLTHIANLVIRLPPRSELLLSGDGYLSSNKRAKSETEFTRRRERCRIFSPLGACHLVYYRCCSYMCIIHIPSKLLPYRCPHLASDPRQPPNAQDCISQLHIVRQMGTRLKCKSFLTKQQDW